MMKQASIALTAPFASAPIPRMPVRAGLWRYRNDRVGLLSELGDARIDIVESRVGALGLVIVTEAELARTPDSFKNLSYTRQVLQEVMRLNPPTYMIGRQALRDVSCGSGAGYRIRRGSYLIINTLGIHRARKSPARAHSAVWRARPVVADSAPADGSRRRHRGHAPNAGRARRHRL